MRKLISLFYHFRTTTLLVVLLIILIASSYIITLIEPETFPRFMDGFYWAMTTITTVGYGDLIPKTDPAKMFAMFIMVVGIIVHAAFVGKILEIFGAYSQQKKEGKLTFMYTNHLVVVYFNKKTRRFIQRVLEANPKQRIVLIDWRTETPFDHPRVHYVQGICSRKETLERANVGQCKSVVIFADPRYSDDHEAADGKTLLNASFIEHHYPEAHTLVELLDEKHNDAFSHSNIDEFIFSDDLASKLAVLGALHPGKVREIRDYMLKIEGRKKNERTSG
ncbi:MAG: potassium channel family protein [Bacilli bacterium]